MQNARQGVEVAGELQVSSGTQGFWFKLYRQDYPEPVVGLQPADDAWLDDLEEAIRRLWMENEYL